jgi:hypothetical protein
MPSYQLTPAEVLEVIYDDDTPGLIYGLKVKILDETAADDETSPAVMTAKPLNMNMLRIPIIGEVVLLLRAPSSYATGVRYTTDTYYIDIVSLQSSVHHNALPTISAKKIQTNATSGNSDKYTETESGNRNQDSEPTVDDNFYEVSTIKPLQPYVGDFIISGRYGNTIRFSTTPKSGKFTVPPRWTNGSEGAPITIFRNTRQFKDTKRFNDYVTEDFTNDENLIVLASGQNIEFEQSSAVVTAIESLGLNSWKTENWGKTPQALISSGRIIFNSSQKEIIAFAKNGIGLSTETSIAIDAKENVEINSKKITLGNGADEPLILGNKFKTWAENLIDSLSTLTVITPAGPSSPLSASPQWATITSLKSQIPFILSDLSFTKKSGSTSSVSSNKDLATPNFSMSSVAKQEVTQIVNNVKSDPVTVTETPEQKQTRDEYLDFKQTEISEEQFAHDDAEDYDIDPEEVEDDARSHFSYAPEGSNSSYASRNSVNSDSTINLDSKSVSKGVSAVKNAIKDIGKTEVPLGSNSGGRVTEMLKTAGVSGPAFWCAAAVTTWWNEAGMDTPSSPASCQSWVNWAKRNGRWSSTPVVGAVAVYLNDNNRAHHVGIVAEIRNDGRIVTIEGNTSGPGFNRNGIGVFKKQPRLSSIGGFVIPA